MAADRVVADLEVCPTSRKAWRAWLRKHHATSPGVWLRFAKKHTGLASPSYVEAVEEALCFGWIDGLVHAVDDTYYHQRFTPRKPKSTWAATNKARLKRLLAEGAMTPAGLAAIALAKKNGSWTTLDSAEALEMPPDLEQALRADGTARRGWPLFTASQRKMLLYRLSSAKREETRARRIAEIVEKARSKSLQ